MHHTHAFSLCMMCYSNMGIYTYDALILIFVVVIYVYIPMNCHQMGSTDSWEHLVVPKWQIARM